LVDVEAYEEACLRSTTAS